MQSFILKNPKAEQETAIRLDAHHPNFPGRRFRYGTGKSILPALWDENTKLPTKEKKLIKEYEKHIPTIANDLENITRKLNDISLAVENFFTVAEIEKTKITTDTLKNYLDEQFRKKVTPVIQLKKENLNEYLSRYIKELEAGIRLNNGNHFVEGSIKNYKTFQAQFDLYQKDNGKMSFEDITIDFYNSFIRFLNGKKYRTNTVGKHIARAKAIMRAALSEGLHTNTDFERKEFKIFQVATDEIYLDEKELKTIEKVNLSEKPHLELYRDIFLIGCYTAQRISDYNKISPHNIITLKTGGKAISLHQKKQKEIVIIPIKKELEAILKKYDYSPPRVQDQKLNENIKTICKIAKINTPTEIEEIIGGKKVKTVMPKYAMVASHTARRTGATLMYNAGIPTIAIMKITGHKKESTFLKYIKVTKEETAEKLSAHEYFN
jgi:integrase